MDFVFPEDNEKEFIEMAKRLGYSSICFIYSLKDFKKVDSDFRVYTAIIEDKRIDKAKQKADFVITKAKEDVRKHIETGKVDLIYGFEEGPRKDFIHYRNSGLNQVLCRIMNAKDISYFLSMAHILDCKDPQFLGRVMQNIRLCRKYKVKVHFGSFALDPLDMRSENDVKSLLKILGSTTRTNSE